jgi:lauroyl/myristoyl acyltransferase
MPSDTPSTSKATPRAPSRDAAVFRPSTHAARHAPSASRRIARDLALLSADDSVNGLPSLLRSWLQDESWVAAASRIPAVERRAWLAAEGAEAFDRNRGGYAAFLRDTTAGLGYVWTSERLGEILRRHTQWLFANLSDVLDFRSGCHATPWDQVIISGDEHLRAARDGGRGVIILSAHQNHPGFGFLHPSWSEIAVSTVANLGDPGAPHGSMLLDGLRDRVEILPITAAALRPMLSRLASGGCVAIYGDFLYEGTPGVLSALFGRLVLIASAAVALALRTGAAVLPMGVARRWPPESDTVDVHVGAPLPRADLDPRDPASREAAALRFGLAVELLIRRDPEVWRLWPSLPSRWHRAEQACQLRQ